MLMNFIAQAIKGGGKKTDPYEQISAMGKIGHADIGPEKKKTQKGPGSKMKQFIDQGKRRDQIGKRA